jgi:hypothetical protein
LNRCGFFCIKAAVPWYRGLSFLGRAKASRRSSIRDLVIATIEELDQAKSMSERVGQNGQLSPYRCANRLFQPRSS